MKNNKHVAIFVPSFSGGGVEKMMVFLANNFVSRGISVDYIVIKNYGPYKKLLSSEVNLVDLKKKRLIFSMFALAKYLRKNTPGVMLSAMNYVNIMVIISTFISFKKIKLIISERAITSLNIKQSKFYVIIKILIKLLYKYPHKIIAISNDVKNDLLRNFNIEADKIIVIFNMVDKKKIESIASNSLKLKLGISENKHVVIGVGRLDKFKNFQYLIHGLEILQKKLDVHLIILGEGHEKENLQNQIKELDLQGNVSLLGFVDNPEEYLKISNLFVSTSTQEGFGNVIIEAMAAGVPVIVTDCLGGPKEIVCFGKYGEIVPLNKPNILAAKMEEVLTKKSHPNVKMRANDFSIEKISQQYLKVLIN